LTVKYLKFWSFDIKLEENIDTNMSFFVGVFCSLLIKYKILINDEENKCYDKNSVYISPIKILIHKYSMFFIMGTKVFAH
jgi:hypothetical protein